MVHVLRVPVALIVCCAAAVLCKVGAETVQLAFFVMAGVLIIVAALIALPAFVKPGDQYRN